MKTKYQLSTLSLAILAVSSSGIAQAITLEDYVDPNSRYENAYISGSFRAANEAANATAGADEAAEETSVGDSIDLNLNVNFEKVNSSLKRVKRVTADAGGSLKSDDNGTRDNIGARVSSSYDKYFDRNPNAFWFGGATLDYEPNREEDIAADATLGLGYGRVINATPLAKALRLAEEFQNYGLLSAYPADDVMLRVAQLINLEQEYESRLGSDSYRTGWYQDIEAEFKNAGILADEGLGALGVIKIDEVLNEESISTRKHGWVARAGATAIIQDHDGNTGEPAFSLGFEYAKPYGYKGQLIDTATYLLGDNSSLTNRLSYSYEVSNTVDWENVWELSLDQPDEGEDVMSNTLSSAFIYEISNQLTLSTGVTVIDVDRDDIATDTSAELVSSIRYRLK